MTKVGSALFAAQMSALAPNMKQCDDPGTGEGESPNLESPEGGQAAAPAYSENNDGDVTVTPPDVTDPENDVPTETDPDDGEAIPVTDPDDVSDEKVDADVDEVGVLDTEDDADDIENIMRFDSMAKASEAIDAFGLNPAAVAIGQASGLFNDTALETMGCEAFGVAGVAMFAGKKAMNYGAQRIAAKYGPKLMKKAATWALRKNGIILPSFSRFEAAAAAASSRFAKVASKVTGKPATVFSRSAGDGAGKAAKAAATKLNGPSALKVAAAIGGVGALVGVVGSMIFSSVAKPKIVSTINSQVSKIKWPFGKLSFRSDAKLGRLYLGEQIARSATADASGFTFADGSKLAKGEIDKITEAVRKAVGGITSANTEAGKKASETISQMVKEAGAKTGVADTVMHTTTSGRLAMGVAIMTALTAIIGYIVIGGLRLLREYFKQVNH